jgi:Ion channel
MIPHEHGYGLLLLLIVAAIGFQLAVPERGWSHLVTILLLGGTFIAALWTSQAPARRLWVASAIVAFVTVGAAIGFVATGEVDDTAARLVSLMLVGLAPIAIVHGLVRHFRQAGGVTVQTMFGVLCIYLLFGSLFAFVYGVVDDVGATPLFGNDVAGTTSDYLYFSFTTMTTTGYGDLTAATDLGRSFAITEQLVGQIYLVTVVAVIVGNLSRGAPRPRPR